MYARSKIRAFNSMPSEVVANSLFITGSWKNNLDLDQGNWKKHNKLYERKTGTKSRVKLFTQTKVVLRRYANKVVLRFSRKLS